MKYLVPLFFFVSVQIAFAQDRPSRQEGIPTRDVNDSERDSLIKKNKKELESITIKDYKIISHRRDTTFLDTTLTIAKEYQYNFLRRDDFELMPFSNVGQPYNRLGVNFERITNYPKLGATAKHFKYLEVEDIDYYNVATPMTDLMFKTTFEQGQFLDAFLTFNLSPRLNLSIAYNGHRSLGKFRFNQSEAGLFRFTGNYETRNKKYAMRAHITAQDIESQENGGISEKELQFESGDDNFENRFNIDVFFTDAENRLLGKRYFLDQEYRLIRKKKDSGVTSATSLTLGHQFNYETKFYEFAQAAQNNFFGSLFAGSSASDRSNLKTMFNQVSASFSNKTLGTLTGVLSLYRYDYFFDSLLITPDEVIENELEGEEVVVGGDYEKQFGNLSLGGSLRYTISGDLTGSLLDASVAYRLNDQNTLGFSIHSSSALPNFNFLLYQSDYSNFNWQNTDTFENERINSLQFTFNSQSLGVLTAKYTTTDNYTYFGSTATPEEIENDLENAFIAPFQEGNSVNYLKIKYAKEFRVGKFALNNTVMYQNVSQTNQVFNVPDLVTRNTLYFSSDVFRKAMYIQTGITFKYFTGYNMDAYNPLLGEFYVQNNEELGAFPLMDFFINAKVKQTRIFLKAEHFNSTFSPPNYYSAPNYPFRDFVIRFGLVWNFFS